MAEPNDPETELNALPRPLEPRPPAPRCGPLPYPAWPTSVDKPLSKIKTTQQVDHAPAGTKHLKSVVLRVTLALTGWADRFHIDAFFRPLCKIETLRVPDTCHARRHDTRVGEAIVEEQRCQRMAVIHPQVTSRPDKCQLHSGEETARSLLTHVATFDKSIGITSGQVLRHDLVKIRRREAHHAAGPQNSSDFVQERRCLPAVKVLNHMRAIHDFYRVICIWNPPGCVGEADILLIHDLSKGT